MFDPMLEQTILILNPKLRLYDFQNERYGFLGAYPYRLGYLRVTRRV